MEDGWMDVQTEGGDGVDQLSELLWLTYRGSDVRVGVVCIELRGRDGEWLEVFEVPAILDPKRGMLLLQEACIFDGELEALAERVTECYGEARELAERVEQRLSLVPGLQGRDIVVGYGVVVYEELLGGLQPKGVPEVAIIDGGKFKRIKSCVKELFEHFTPRGGAPASEWTGEMIKAVVEEEVLGGFLGEDFLEECFGGELLQDQ